MNLGLGGEARAPGKKDVVVRPRAPHRTVCRWFVGGNKLHWCLKGRVEAGWGGAGEGEGTNLSRPRA